MVDWPSDLTMERVQSKKCRYILWDQYNPSIAGLCWTDSTLSPNKTFLFSLVYLGQVQFWVVWSFSTTPFSCHSEFCQKHFFLSIQQSWSILHHMRKEAYFGCLCCSQNKGTEFWQCKPSGHYMQMNLAAKPKKQRVSISSHHFHFSVWHIVLPF